MFAKCLEKCIVSPVTMYSDKTYKLNCTCEVFRTEPSTE